MPDNFNVNININDNSKEVREALEKATSQCLYAMGTLAVEGAVTSISGSYASGNQAVDTGRLRASISFVTANGYESGAGEQIPKAGVSQSKFEKNKLKPDDILSGKAPKDSVLVGSNVEYAEAVHNGTSKMLGRPFLREGIDKTKDEMEKLIVGILKGEY